MRLEISSLIVAAVVMGWAPGATRAGIISTTEAAQEVEPPEDVRTGRHESDSDIAVFAEAIGVSAEKPIKVDISKTGEAIKSVPRVGRKGRRKKKKKAVAHWSPKRIAAGTLINSYYIHFDPVGGGKSHRTLSGSVTFEEKVLGIIVTTEKLIATNEFPGLTETQYARGRIQGVEVNRNTRVALSPNRRTVSFTLPVSNGADNLRIITDASPSKTKSKAKRKTDKKKNDAPTVDPLPVGSVWSGIRTDVNHGREYKCRMTVIERRGNIVIMHVGERRFQGLRMEWKFKLKKNQLQFVNFGVTSLGHERISIQQARGATANDRIEIEYQWMRNDARPRGHKNRIESGAIQLILER